ncbi:MAG: response regulator [Anaerolineaceae bacterium]
MHRILIVDDVLELGRFLQAALATMDKNLDIRVMATAEEALLEVTRQAVDLLVTEVRLPGISGIDLVRRIRSRFPQVKVIFISSLTNKKIDQQIEELHADAYFHKPMQIPQFLEAAAHALGIQPAWELEEEEPLETGENLSGRLAHLQRTLNGNGVYLLDDRGRMIAQTGEDVGRMLEKLIPSLMSAMNATSRLARMLTERSKGFSCVISGDMNDILFAPVGDFVLVAVIPGGNVASRSVLAHAEMLQVQEDIAAILFEMGIQVTVTPEIFSGVDKSFGEADKIPISLPEVKEKEEDVFTKKLNQAAKSMSRQTVEEFWSSQVSSGKFEAMNPDILSYEQAKQLGIAPVGEGKEISSDEN